MIAAPADGAMDPPMRRTKRGRKPKRSPFTRAARAIGQALLTLQREVGELPSSLHRLGYVSRRIDGAVGYPESAGTWSIVCALDEADDAAAIFDGIRAACRG